MGAGGCRHRRLDLIHHFLARYDVFDPFVVMDAFGKNLVFDMQTGNAGPLEFFHRTHYVQRFSEAGSRVNENGNLHCVRNITAGMGKFGKGHQRFADYRTYAKLISAEMHAFDAEGLRHARRVGIPNA